MSWCDLNITKTKPQVEKSFKFLGIFTWVNNGEGKNTSIASDKVSRMKDLTIFLTRNLPKLV